MLSSFNVHRNGTVVALALISALMCLSLGCGGGGDDESSQSSYEAGDDSSSQGSSDDDSDQLASGNSGGNSTSGSGNPINGSNDNRSTYPNVGTNNSGGGSTSGTGNGTGNGGLSNSNSGGTPFQPPSLSGNQLDQSTYEVPRSGDVNELRAFISQMENMLQQAVSQEDQEKINLALVEAAELLYRPEADELTRMSAVQFKATALQRLNLLNYEGARQRLDEYCEVLQKDDNPYVAAIGAMYAMGAIAQDYFSVEMGDFGPLRDAFTHVVTEYNDNPQVFEMSYNLVSALLAMEKKAEGEELLSTAAQSFLVSANPELAQQGNELVDQLKLVQLDYNGYRYRVYEKEEGAAAQLVEASRRVFGADKPSPFLFSEVMGSARLLEAMHEFDAAREVYGLLEQAGIGHPDPNLTQVAEMAVPAALTRMGLIGQNMNVEGAMLNGDPFDWSPYQGKFVLVFFWHTYWPDSLYEVQNYEALLQSYSEQPFDIIGVNLDEQRSQAQAYLDQFPHPFTNIRTADETLVGIETPLAKLCGVDSPPFNMLIDPNGMVVAVHLYQEEIMQTVDAYLGIQRPQEQVDPIDNTGGATGEGVD